MDKIIESVSLYSDHGGSDKVYNVQIVQSDDGFRVNYQNGKRGNSLTSGTKTKQPVSEAVARKEFDKLVKSKVNGDSHYRPIDAEEGAYVAPVERETTGIQPTMLVAIDLDSAEARIRDSTYVMQQKFMGERLVTEITSSDVVGTNKKGFRRGIPDVLKNALTGHAGHTLDSEIIGNEIYVFDILSHSGKDVRRLSCEDRISLMEKTVAAIASPNVIAVKTYRTEEEKREAFAVIKERGGEGVVFKVKDAPYVEARSDNGLKYKFTDTASFIVTEHNKTKRSVKIGLMFPEGIRSVSNLTISAKFDIPPVGEIVEVEYLYANEGTCAPQEGRYQGQTRGHELDAKDCTPDQLKFGKVTVEDEEDFEADMKDIEQCSEGKKPPKKKHKP